MNPDIPLFILLNHVLSTLHYVDYALIIFLLLLLLLNIFISSSEVALLSLEDNDIDKLKNSASIQKINLLEVLSSSDRLLTSILVVYKMVNVAIAAILVYILRKISFFLQSDLTLLLLLLGIALVLILVVEIIPKLFASHNPLRVVEKNIKGVLVINACVSPISSFLVRYTNIFNPPSVQQRHEISMDDLSKALELTSSEISHEQEKDMLEGIIRFRDKDVSDILISRADMFSLEIHNSFKRVISFIIDAGFSRIPVYEDNEDRIKGVLYVKDLLPHIGKNENFNWQTLIRPAYFVPENKRIDELLEEFRTNKNHMAIVVDEYGGTTGIVTMEDILEEIVGDISDEYDEDVPLYIIEDDGSYLFDGKTSLVDFLKLMDIPEKDFDDVLEDVDTLAGLILELKGTFPKQKESFNYKKYQFQVEEMNKRRIVKVKYFPLHKKLSDG